MEGGLRAEGFDPRDINSESFLALPSSSVLTHSLGKGRHRLAYSTFLHSEVDENFGGTFADSWVNHNGDQVDMVLHGGRRLRDRIVLIGPSYAFRASDTFSLGISAFYARRDQTIDTWSDYQEDHSTKDTGAPVRSVFFDDRVATMVTDGAVFARLGLMWRPSDAWSMGLTLDTTSVQIEGTASVYAKYSQSGEPDAVDPQEQQPQRGSESYDGYEARTQHAWGAAAGVAHRFNPALLISTSAWLALPLNYHRTNLGQAEANELQLVNEVDRQMTWNAAVGVEWLVTPSLPVRLGVFSNRSAAAELPAMSAIPLAPKVDLYGATLSVGYKDGPRAANIGVEAQWGSGADMVAGGVDQSAADRSWIRANREQFRFVVFMSGAMALAKKEARGYLLDKIKKLRAPTKPDAAAPADRPAAPLQPAKSVTPTVSD